MKKTNFIVIAGMLLFSSPVWANASGTGTSLAATQRSLNATTNNTAANNLPVNTVKASVVTNASGTGTSFAVTQRSLNAATNNIAADNLSVNALKAPAVPNALGTGTSY